MPDRLTEVTEITTALGMLAPNLERALFRRSDALLNVPDVTWDAIVQEARAGRYHQSFVTAFENGHAFLDAADGLRGRAPVRVEWKGGHRPPGDDVVPADLRIDHVYLVSCKYLSRVLLNAGPARLFDRLLVGDERTSINWYFETAMVESQALYDASKAGLRLLHLPRGVGQLSRADQLTLKTALAQRTWPPDVQGEWAALSRTVARASANRWAAAMRKPRDRLRMLWRLLRITSASYFVLGTDRTSHLRLRVDSAWDWNQAYRLRALEVEPRSAGQPEVGWRATVEKRVDRATLEVDGHVEVRWSHGRFLGAPEAKVYLDTPHLAVPGFNVLS